MSFYKTKDPNVLAAWNEEHAARAKLQAEADAFAERFGGNGRLYADPARFAGLTFSPAKPRDLWRAPDHNGLQWPRSVPLRGATAETKEALKALQAEWLAHLPSGRVSREPIYRALGFSSSMDFLLEGLTLFVHDGILYASTRKTIRSMTEILGSEYHTAESALRSAGGAA
jgi:hypothetical protein